MEKNVEKPSNMIVLSSNIQIETRKNMKNGGWWSLVANKSVQ
jgi:hypothetical protein